VTTWTLDIVEVGIIPHLPWNIYLPDAPPDNYLDVPCYCYLLSSPAGCLLIDTGPDRDRSAAANLEIVGDACSALTTALQRRGRTPDDVELILQTHLHYDHVQNLDLFPRAEVVVRQTELDWARSPDSGPFYVGIDEFLTLAGDRLRPVEGEQTVRPGVTLLPNGGHTPGHQSILVETAEGTTCIAADILPVYRNMEVLPPSYDPAATTAFRDRVLDAGWEVLPGHDPELRGHRWFGG
jgi:glyoxylase-like metal-dependent hydrolase (beta-lactamase superfamily II)